MKWLIKKHLDFENNLLEVREKKIIEKLIKPSKEMKSRLEELDEQIERLLFKTRRSNSSRASAILIRLSQERLKEIERLKQ